MYIHINYNCSAISFNRNGRTRAYRFTNYDIFNAVCERIARKYTYIGAYDGGWQLGYEKVK